jgi:hypothetical protein
MSNIWHWSQENGLSLNPQKSQAIVISSQSLQTSHFPPILLNGCVVPYYEKVKKLGLIINTVLSTVLYVVYERPLI